MKLINLGNGKITKLVGVDEKDSFPIMVFDCTLSESQLKELCKTDTNGVNLEFLPSSSVILKYLKSEIISKHISELKVLERYLIEKEKYDLEVEEY